MGSKRARQRKCHSQRCVKEKFRIQERDAPI
jgi:hypothetical protein